MERCRNLQFAFFSTFILIYLLQQVGRREDWPFTFFGMYRGSRPSTSPFYRFEPKYIEDSSGEVINLYEFKVDRFFLDERIRSILLGSKEGFNNDMLVGPTRLNKEAQSEVQKYLKNNMIPLLKEQCKHCKSGVLHLEVKFWKNMTFHNFLNPDSKGVYTQVRYSN